VGSARDVAVGMGYCSDKDCFHYWGMDCFGMDLRFDMGCFGMGLRFGMGYFGWDFPIEALVVVIVEVGPIEALVVDHCRFCYRFGFRFRTSRFEGLG
jgi:hypothetical protein